MCVGKSADQCYCFCLFSVSKIRENDDLFLSSLNDIRLCCREDRNTRQLFNRAEFPRSDDFSRNVATLRQGLPLFVRMSVRLIRWSVRSSVRWQSFGSAACQQELVDVYPALFIHRICTADADRAKVMMKDQRLQRLGPDLGLMSDHVFDATRAT